jgi:predicted negative regulator of RcsB-dependent stress response
MKSDHRHELKTNELAEWLSNLPQWTKENLVTIIGIVVIIVAVIVFYAWRTYNKNVLQVREQLEFTSLINQISRNKVQIIQAQSPSFILLQLAKSLETFAMNARNNEMAALAYIKHAETLRADLLYRSGNISNQDLTTQINSAKASYNAAIKRCPSDPSLTSTAQFGLGLCDEELGNFDEAKNTYKDIVANPDFKGTLAVAQAKERLACINDYTKEVTFLPAPKPKVPPEVTPAEVNRPIGYQPPEGAPKIEILPQAPNLTTEIPIVKPKAQAPNSTPVVPEVNSQNNQANVPTE